DPLDGELPVGNGTGVLLHVAHEGVAAGEGEPEGPALVGGVVGVQVPEPVEVLVVVGVGPLVHELGAVHGYGLSVVRSPGQAYLPRSLAWRAAWSLMPMT